jgi:hypothetical protein
METFNQKEIVENQRVEAPAPLTLPPAGRIHGVCVPLGCNLEPDITLERPNRPPKNRHALLFGLLFKTLKSRNREESKRK